MHGVSTSNHSWFAISPTRCKEIVDGELQGISVDLTWYESLCDFLSKCFCCGSDSPVTHASIAEAAKGLVSAQIQISDILEQSLEKELSAGDLCLDILKTASDHARTLSWIINGRDGEYEVIVKPDEKNQFAQAVASGEQIGIYIRKRNLPQLIFMLSCVVPKSTSTREFAMVPMPDPQKNNSQEIVKWETAENRCDHIARRGLSTDDDKQRFFQELTSSDAQRG